MDFSDIIPLCVDLLKASLPIGIVFALTERVTQFFMGMAFPKK